MTYSHLKIMSETITFQNKYKRTGTCVMETLSMFSLDLIRLMMEYVDELFLCHKISLSIEPVNIEARLLVDHKRNFLISYDFKLISLNSQGQMQKQVQFGNGHIGSPLIQRMCINNTTQRIMTNVKTSSFSETNSLDLTLNDIHKHQDLCQDTQPTGLFSYENHYIVCSPAQIQVWDEHCHLLSQWTVAHKMKFPALSHNKLICLFDNMLSLVNMYEPMDGEPKTIIKMDPDMNLPYYAHMIIGKQDHMFVFMKQLNHTTMLYEIDVYIVDDKTMDESKQMWHANRQYSLEFDLDHPPLDICFNEQDELFVLFRDCIHVYECIDPTPPVIEYVMGD